MYMLWVDGEIECVGAKKDVLAGIDFMKSKKIYIKKRQYKPDKRDRILQLEA